MDLASARERIVSVVAGERTIDEASAKRVADSAMSDLDAVTGRLRQVIGSQSHVVIGVTGATAGDGASTSAALMAIGVAFHSPSRSNGPPGAAGTCLLVDADLRRPAQHQLFGVEASPGLWEVLEGERTLDEVVRPVLPPELGLVPAGSPPWGSRSLSAGMGAIARVVDDARNRHAAVLIDLPPLLVVPEAEHISTLCDGVVLVVRADKTRQEVMQQAQTRLEAAGSRLLGVILNRRRFYVPAKLYRWF